MSDDTPRDDDHHIVVVKQHSRENDVAFLEMLLEEEGLVCQHLGEIYNEGHRVETRPNRRIVCNIV